jgi:hypothetical protein
MAHLFTAEDVFQIEGCGCVPGPGILTGPDSPTVSIGERIRLRTPAVLEIDSVVRAVEMISYRKRPEKIFVPILLPIDISKDMVPVGTEAHLLREI